MDAIEQDEAEFIAAVNEGLRDAEEGRVRPAREALAELGARLGFPIHTNVDPDNSDADRTRS